MRTTRIFFGLLPTAFRFAGLVLLLSAAGCAGNQGGGSASIKPPKNVRVASATPPHNLPPHEYPFDAAGNYRTDWVRPVGGSSRSTRSRSTSRPTYTSRSSGSSSSSSSKPAPKPAPPKRTHTIAKGETLWAISRRYGTSVAAIKSSNGLRSDLIHPGQVLKIP